MAVQLSPNLLRSPLVDQKGIVTREWLNFFQETGSSITQTTVNQTIISEDKSASSFDTVGGVMDSQALVDEAITLDLWGQPVAETQDVYQWQYTPEPVDEPVIDWSAPSVPALWDSFTTAATPAGAMVFTVSAQDCSYTQVGDTVHYRVDITGTISGTVSASIALTLPAGAYKVQSAHGHGIIGAGNRLIFGTISGTTVTVENYDNTTFTLGSLRIILTGIYQAA
jgi:hypothetical protein